jgi:hypothetical protein
MPLAGSARLIGLVVCCLGCAKFQPIRREPPPPKMEPMPPPDPAAARPAPAAEAAAAAQPEHVLEWDAGARTIRCGEDVALPIPAGLTIYERADEGGELTVTPPGSPPGAALIVIDIGSTGISIDGDQNYASVFKAFVERMDRAGKRLDAALERLAAIVSGPWRPVLGDHADLRTGDDGVFDAVFTPDGLPGPVWRFVFTQAGACVFVAVEMVLPDAAQRFAPRLQRMCANKKSSCRSTSKGRVNLTSP